MLHAHAGGAPAAAVKEELGGADPSRAPKFLLEYLKTWHLMIIVIVFTVAIVISAGIGQIAPAPYTVESTKHNLNGTTLDALYRQNATVYHETQFLWGPNQDWFASFRLEARRNLDRSVGKENLLVLVSLDYRDSAFEPWTSMVSDEDSQAYNRRLHCRQNAMVCDRIFVAHEPNIRHYFYRIGIQILNGADLYDEGYLGDIHTSVMYTSTGYSLFELFWRFMFLLINVATIVIFAAMTIISRMNPLKAAIEQKLVMMMLVALLLFNNPLFVFDVFFNWIIVFPMLNTLFMSSFIATFLFYILVLLHATILRKPGRRSFISFYLPKILWIFGIWLINVATQIWAHFQSTNDPTQPIVDSSDAFTSTIARVSWIVSLVLLLGYGFWVLYLLFRGFGKMTRHRLANIDSRFKFVWLVTFITLAATGGFAGFFVFGGGNNAIAFICYWALYNMYICFSAIVYAPTTGRYSPREVQKNIQQAVIPPPENAPAPTANTVDDYGVAHREIDMTDMQQLRDEDEEMPRFNDSKPPEEMHEINFTEDESAQQPQFGDSGTGKSQYM